LPKHNPKKTFLNFRNALYILLKNLPARILIWKFPIRIMIDYIAIMKFILTGAFGDAQAVLLAHLHVAANGIKQLRKRPAKQQDPALLRGYYKGMILFDYHVLRRRRFSDLNVTVSTK
jgi:hypothetical protein